MKYFISISLLLHLKGECVCVCVGGECWCCVFCKWSKSFLSWDQKHLHLFSLLLLCGSLPFYLQIHVPLPLSLRGLISCWNMVWWLNLFSSLCCSTPPLSPNGPKTSFCCLGTSPKSFIRMWNTHSFVSHSVLNWMPQLGIRLWMYTLR